MEDNILTYEVRSLYTREWGDRVRKYDDYFAYEIMAFWSNSKEEWRNLENVNMHILIRKTKCSNADRIKFSLMGLITNLKYYYKIKNNNIVDITTVEVDNPENSSEVQDIFKKYPSVNWICSSSFYEISERHAELIYGFREVYGGGFIFDSLDPVF